MASTKAVETRSQAVSPVSILGGGAGAADGVAPAPGAGAPAAGGASVACWASAIPPAILYMAARNKTATLINTDRRMTFMVRLLPPPFKS
jgi:hypothetical protein